MMQGSGLKPEYTLQGQMSTHKHRESSGYVCNHNQLNLLIFPDFVCRILSNSLMKES